MSGSGEFEQVGRLNGANGAIITINQATGAIVLTPGTDVGVSIRAQAGTGAAIAELNDLLVDLSAILSFVAGGGSLSFLRTVLINGRTYQSPSGAVTVQEAATVAIGVPVAGSNVTLTHIAALLLAGNLRFLKELNEAIAIADSTTDGVAGGSLTVQAGSGAPSTAGNAGAGGAVSVVARPGGASTAAVGNAGGGGSVAITAGAGGSESGVGNLGNGGAGGTAAVTAGNGGNASGQDTAGGTNGGDGGGLTIAAGNGGNAVGGTANSGGQAGDATISAGNSGSGNSGGTNRRGGNVSILGGTGTRNGNGGRVQLTPGPLSGTGLKPLVELDAAGSVPTSAVLGSGFVGFKYNSGGTLVAYVNDGGTIKSISLGTPS